MQGFEAAYGAARGLLRRQGHSVENTVRVARVHAVYGFCGGLFTCMNILEGSIFYVGGMQWMY